MVSGLSQWLVKVSQSNSIKLSWDTTLVLGINLPPCMLYPPVSVGGVIPNSRQKVRKIGVRLPTSPKPVLQELFQLP